MDETWSVLADHERSGSWDDRDTIREIWDRHRNELRRPSRQEYRESGNQRKANRPRGGGAKSKWFSEYQRLTRENPYMTKTDIISEIGPCPQNQTALKSGKGK